MCELSLSSVWNRLMVVALLGRLKLVTWSFVFQSQGFDVSMDMTLSRDTEDLI